MTLGMPTGALALALLLAAVSPPDAAPRPRCAAPWPLWRAYVEHFVSDDGRVIEHSRGARTTSEGQAYALFFALVADDRERFAALLRWSEDNLARGDLAARLPAWLWGKGEQGKWRALDRNAAADADLWLCYVLLEAGRLWNAPEYEQLARRMMARVAATEVVEVGPGMALLLPGPHGFALKKGEGWRLNPSYTPLQLLRRLAAADPDGPWERVLRGSVRMIEQTTPHGLAADWVAYERGVGFRTDPIRGDTGSYDAIRTYLWAAMLHPAEPHRAAMQRALRGMYAHWLRRGSVPERIDARTGRVSARAGPVGFHAVLLPRAAGADGAALERLSRQVTRVRAGELYGAPPTYYDQNLVLFAQGFVEGRYRFDAGGALQPSWETACRAP